MKHIEVIFCFLLLNTNAFSEDSCSDGQWSWTYKKTFSNSQAKKNSRDKKIIFTEVNTPPFSQLIFSWNAARPAQGSFIFYGQVRNVDTGKWGVWHKMIEWGDHVQRSFFNKEGDSSFAYAHLDTCGGTYADGFRIKVVSENNADLSLVKGLVSSLSNLSLFASEPYGKRGKELESVFVNDIPTFSQMVIDHPRARALCSPTALSMVVGGIKHVDVDPHAFSDFVYDEGLGIFGNWGFNTAHAYEHLGEGILVYAARLDSFASLHKELQHSFPVVVSIRGYIAGGALPYTNGHLVVVTGWDAKNKKVICHDSAFDSKDKVRVAYDLHSFVRAWERSRRLAYKVELLV